jgi:N-acetylmuramoyl-L-alanine amidase
LALLLAMVLVSCGGQGAGVTSSTASTAPSTSLNPDAPSSTASSTTFLATTSTTGVATTATTTEPDTSTTATATTSTTTSSTGGGSLAGKTVVLDPGHNGKNWAHPEEINRQVDIGTGVKACNTTGTSTVDGYAEPSFTWEVAQRTVPLLEALGAKVVLTRSDNNGWGPCITERAAIGNEAHADAVISIHADGGPEGGRGFHVIYPAVVKGLTDDIAVASQRLAKALHTAYQTTGMPIADYVGDGGFSVRDDLGGLTLSDVPAVFLEAGNMRNTEDAALLEDAEFQKSIAEAITEAIVAFLNTSSSD